MSLHKRVILILYIVSTTVSLFFLAAALERVSVRPDHTSYTDGTVIGDQIYYAQNRMGQGLIFQMDEIGDVSHVYSSLTSGEKRVVRICEAPAGSETVLCAVLSSSVFSEEEGEKTKNWYRIVGLDRKLRLQVQTTRFLLPEDEVLTGFSAEATGLFLTTVTTDGSTLQVYGIRNEELKESVVPTEPLRPESIRTRTAKEDRFFVQARYAGGELEVRTDRDAPVGSFAVDERVTAAVSGMNLGLEHNLVLYRNLIITYLAILLVWFIVLGLIIRMLTGRSRLVYSLAVAEVVLVIITGVGIWALTAQSENTRRTEHIRFALLSLESLQDEAGITEYIDYGANGYYDSDQYQAIRRSMAAFVRRSGNREVFYDVLVLRLSDNTVVTSASGRNQENAAYLFGGQMKDLSDDIYRGKRYAKADLVIDDQNYLAVGMADSTLIADYAIVGIINETSEDAGVWADHRGTLILFLFVFTLGSVLVVGVWYLQTSDLRSFEEALKDTALGRSMKERPRIWGGDLKEMWDSLSEVRRLIEETNYSKLRTLEAYFRFAPKNIERVMDRDSIMEVRNGDMRDLAGSLALISLADQGISRPALSMEDVIDRIGDWQRDHAGMLASVSPDLSSMEVLFLDEEHDTVAFMTSVICDHLQSGALPSLSATMLYDVCTFGVTGSGEEALTWHTTQHQALFYQMAPFFRKLKLGLVISEFIKLREEVQGPLRFIGYIQPEGESDPIRFYEVLDAYPARQRAAMINALPAFSEALTLFYEKDYYLARTKFSDILRVMPEDALVKWYIFESDRYLNGEADEKLAGSLHL